MKEIKISTIFVKLFVIPVFRAVHTYRSAPSMLNLGKNLQRLFPNTSELPHCRIMLSEIQLSFYQFLSVKKLERKHTFY